jgi:AcrR family transcriptional regulator
VGSPARQNRSGETVLQRQLAEGAPVPKASAIDAFALARQRFLAGERVEMGSIAEELGLNRVTVYRWVGSREQLLVEVLWSLAEPTLNHERQRVEATGSERVVQVLTSFIVAVLSNNGVARFVSEEPELAIRLMTRPEAGFQPRLMAWVHDLLEEETSAGRLELPGELSDSAYGIVRVLESYISLDLIQGLKPDAERAEHIFRLILR